MEVSEGKRESKRTTSPPADKESASRWLEKSAMLQFSGRIVIISRSVLAAGDGVVCCVLSQPARASAANSIAPAAIARPTRSRSARGIAVSSVRAYTKQGST